MGRRSCFGVILVVSLLANAFCLPSYAVRPRRQSDNTNTTKSDVSISKNNDISYPSNDDDDDFDTSSQSSSGGGSSISSLLNLLGAFFPGSSSSSTREAPNTPNTPGAPTPPSPLWTLKMDILRALLQFGSSVIGLASSSIFSSSSSFG